MKIGGPSRRACPASAVTSSRIEFPSMQTHDPRTPSRFLREIPLWFVIQSLSPCMSRRAGLELGTVSYPPLRTRWLGLEVPLLEFSPG
jgi:hypothetical protein